SMSLFKDKFIDLSLFSYQFLRHTKHDNIKCEILYIGKANDLKNRVNAHESIQQAQSECLDNEEIYLYFFTPKFESIGHNTFYIDNIESEKKTLICEAGLINYFKPEMNDYHKNSDITKSGTLKILREKQYTEFIIQCIFDENDYHFETKHIPKSGTHTKAYQLKNK
ncbi:hypothetical protein NAG84_17275, partial [Proteus terrae]|nr:hypothetical protein [Proteus terrae]